MRRTTKRRRGKKHRNVKRVRRVARRQRLILKYRRCIAQYEKKLDRTIKAAVKDMGDS